MIKLVQFGLKSNLVYYIIIEYKQNLIYFYNYHECTLSQIN